VFRCTADGKKLEQIARGFWNPFGTCVDPWGRIFAVDNDPGSSPPCRLLHVVPGGDYGYQYQHGRRGIHPFLAWDGELIGTLPMVHGTGEAPCEVIHFNSPMFPNKYRGELLSTSWGDHRIERYRLKRRGASVTATMEPLVQGDDSFRPVGLAMAPDGSLFVSDWGSSSYNLNHKGRLWRISCRTDEKPKPLKQPTYIARDIKRLQELREPTGKDDLPMLLSRAQHNDRFVQSAALYGLRHHVDALLKMDLKDLPTGKRVAALYALKKSRRPEGIQRIPALLANPQPAVRFEAARWIADHQLKQFRPAIETALRKGNYDYRLFRAYLATLDALDERKNPDRVNEEFALPLLKNADTLDNLRAHVLRYLPGGHKALTSGQLTAWLKSKEKTLQHEAVWKMRHLTDEATVKTMRGIALDENRDLPLRLAAVAAMGLSESPDAGALMKIATGNNASLRDESLRSLIGANLEANDNQRLTELAAQHTSTAPAIKRMLGQQFAAGRPAPTDAAAWLKRFDALPGKADAAAGERIFFNQKIALCSRCHQVGERGTRIGPDLTVIGRRNNPQRLLESILQPSKEVAPYMRPWTITMNDDSVHTGIALRRGGNAEVYLGLDGKEIRIDKRQIKSKNEGRISLMPEGLALSLTDRELRDLLAFLMAQR
jgi:putative heme-binding domain-containing protein